MRRNHTKAKRKTVMPSIMLTTRHHRRLPKSRKDTRRVSNQLLRTTNFVDIMNSSNSASKTDISPKSEEGSTTNIKWGWCVSQFFKSNSRV